MPVPSPNQNESEDAFVSRCISFLSHEDKDRPREQIEAICYSQWREAKKACPSCTGVLACPSHERQQPLLTDIIKRLESVKDFIIGKFGEAGRVFYENTLVRLGVYDAKTMKYNCNLLKSDLALPFVKLDGENAFQLHNIILSEGVFSKIDDVEHTVAAYANTIVSDCVDDIVLPESYKDSANAYNKPIFFMHHLDVPAGDFLSGVVDEIGWIVKSRPKPTFWSLIKDGTLKGYSIGGWFAGVGKQIGKALVWSYDVRINDVSYVTNPCNKLSFFALLKSKSSNMTAGNGEIIAACNGVNVAKEKIKEEKKKMSEKPIEAANPQATEKKLGDMNNDEIVGYIKSQASKEERARLLKIAQATDEELKAHEEDTRIVEINKTLGVLTAKLDGVIKSIAELGVKFAGAEMRLVKMEEMPSLKPTGAATGDEEFDDAIGKATSFDQVDALVRAKTSKVNPQ